VPVDRPTSSARLLVLVPFKGSPPTSRVDLGNVTKTATDYYLLVRRMAADDSCTRLFIIICTSHTNTSIAYLHTYLLTYSHACPGNEQPHVSCQGVVSPVPVITANDCIYQVAHENSYNVSHQPSGRTELTSVAQLVDSNIPAPSRQRLYYS
jgi:hypothetical protein